MVHKMSYSNNSPNKVLTQWLSSISKHLINKCIIILIETDMFKSLFHSSYNNDSLYGSIGTFNRSLKKILEQQPSINNIFTRNVRENNRRKTFVILTSSDSINSDMSSKSDMHLDPASRVSDINDSRIQFLKTLAPSQVPTKTTSTSSSVDDIQPVIMPSPTLIVTPTNITNPSILRTTNSTKYPLLSSLGIETNFETDDNERKITNLLAELISLHKNAKKELNFSHHGNCKPGVLIQVPNASTYNSYNRNERRNNWLATAMNFIAKHSKNNSTVEEVTSWLIRDVHKKYPSTFLNVATDLGLHVVQTMSHIEAAAMWTEANVPIRVARIILSHLNKKFKNKVQVPFSQIQILGNITHKLKPTFGSFLYSKKNNSSEKVKEKIEFWKYSITDLLELDFERLLLIETPPNIGFGYNSKVFGNKKGVMIVIGSDHGGGKSRFLLRTNYLDSNSRRNINKVDYGTRTIQFAEVKCKKDVHEVHAQISPSINMAIKKLEISMMVSVRFGKKN